MTEQANQATLSYSEVPLDDVIKFFFKGYRPKEGETLKLDDWVIDQVKGKVIFKIIAEKTKGGSE